MAFKYFAKSSSSMRAGTKKMGDYDLRAFLGEDLIICCIRF
jgi:hypothetical protein